MSKRHQRWTKRSPPNDPPVFTPTSPPEPTIRTRPSDSPIQPACIPTVQQTIDRGQTIGQTRGTATEAS